MPRQRPAWLRPIGFGFLLAFASAPGQTFFIGLSSGAVRRELGLEHWELSALYTGATLLSGASVFAFGGIADRPGTVRTTLGLFALLALGCGLMSTATGVVGLAVALVLLRSCGQGMLGHVAMTALGRHFEQGRGRALAVASLGYPLAEGLLPAVVAVGASAASWRFVWLAGAATLLLMTPVVWFAGRGLSEVTPRHGPAPSSSVSGPSRREVLRDPRFRLTLPAVLLPPFVLTGVFFHQSHLAESRGWSLVTWAQLYPAYAVAATVTTVAAGWWVDRTSAQTLLRWSLVPLAGGLALLGFSRGVGGAAGFFALSGITAGSASVLQGTLWPELFGIGRLGQVRSLAVAGMVLSTALAPTVVGAGLDVGLSVDTQLRVALAMVVAITLRLQFPCRTSRICRGGQIQP